MKRDIDKLRHNAKGICRLAEMLDYDGSLGPTFSDGTNLGCLVEFFNDNPGACDAVFEWAKDHFADDEDDDEDDPEQHLTE